MNTTRLNLDSFDDGKYIFCEERRCELQCELCDGDPAHLECWLCILAYYGARPHLDDLYTLDEIEALRIQ